MQAFLFLIDPNDMYSGALEGLLIKQPFKRAGEPEQQMVEADIGWITIQNHLLFLEADG
jgi:hypothetical protein